MSAYPAFAESTTANTTISVTIQGAPQSTAPIGGGWNFRLPPAVFPPSSPIVVELSTQMYSGIVEEKVPTYEDPVRKRSHLQSSSSTLPNHPAAKNPRKKPMIEYIRILSETESHESSVGNDPKQQTTPETEEKIALSIQEKKIEEKAMEPSFEENTIISTQLLWIPERIVKIAKTTTDNARAISSWIMASLRGAFIPAPQNISNPEQTSEETLLTITKDPVQVWTMAMHAILVLLLALILWIIFSRKVQKPWHTFNIFILLTVCSYGAVMLLEYVGAASMTVSFTVSNMSLSCEGSVALGTIAITGNTGPYSSARKTTCTIETSNANGYALQWKTEPLSGGTGTGSLRSENGDTIAAYTPVVTGTPEIWSMATNASEWGGRVSSTSTTMSTGIWGADGSSEKWMNVSMTGSTIVTRNSATGGSPDTENIGFTAEVGSNKSQPAGTYQARIVFTAITN